MVCKRAGNGVADPGGGTPGAVNLSVLGQFRYRFHKGFARESRNRAPPPPRGPDGLGTGRDRAGQKTGISQKTTREVRLIFIRVAAVLFSIRDCSGCGLRPVTGKTSPGGKQPQRKVSAPVLSISLLGGMGLLYDGHAVRLGNRRARALLAYLALSDSGRERREHLAALFWGDNSEHNARASLRQVLFDARDTLAALGCDALVPGRDHVELVAGSTELDITAMLNEINRGSIPSALLTQTRVSDTILAGYEDLGPAFGEWLTTARRGIHERLLRALEQSYMDTGVQQRERRLLADAALRLDPLHEGACRAVMRLAAEDGEIGAALRAYAELYEALGNELDMEPSAATQNLVAEIKQGHFDAPPPAPQPIAYLEPAPRTSLSPSGAPVVAVMPFRSVGPDPVPDYFAEGVLEDTVCMLTTLREPVVISSNSTRSLRDQPTDLHAIGQRFGAQYAVTGMLRSAGKRIRLSVQLADVERGTVIWAAPYDAPEPALFEAQADIAANIARALVPRVRDAELRRSRGHRPESLTAYHLMIQARALVFRLEQPALEEAGDLLRRAIALDPTYGPSHAALAEWHGVRIGQGWSPDVREDAQALEAMARQAIGLDSGNGRALALLAHNRTILHRQHDEALGLIDRALDASPNDAEALMWTGPTYAFVGREREAVERLERAIALSPDDPFMFRYQHFLSIAHYAATDYATAVHWGERSLQANPYYTSGLRTTAAALAGLGRTAEAKELASRIMEVEPGFRTTPMIARHAFRDEVRRKRYGQHLIEAGLPP